MKFCLKKSRESVNSVGEDDFDDESLSLSLSSEKEHQDKELDFLNQLNKDLNSQLRSQSYNGINYLFSKTKYPIINLKFLISILLFQMLMIQRARQALHQVTLR